MSLTLQIQCKCYFQTADCAITEIRKLNSSGEREDAREKQRVTLHLHTRGVLQEVKWHMVERYEWKKGDLATDMKMFIGVDYRSMVYSAEIKKSVFDILPYSQVIGIISLYLEEITFIWFPVNGG